MNGYLKPEQAIQLLKDGVKLEYCDEEGFWFNLIKDQPIRLLWEYKIRIKQ